MIINRCRLILLSEDKRMSNQAFESIPSENSWREMAAVTRLDHKIRFTSAAGVFKLIQKILPMLSQGGQVFLLEKFYQVKDKNF